jgi:hypothetical protein
VGFAEERFTDEADARTLRKSFERGAKARGAFFDDEYI